MLTIIWAKLVISLEFIKTLTLVIIITKGKIKNKHNFTWKMYSYKIEELSLHAFKLQFSLDAQNIVMLFYRESNYMQNFFL